ncbi:Alpha/beta hydrolase fold-3 [Kalmanozyma brasiliensis GHG001]|uniref:Alpha/beta hydrolase fold-3 domain-containing protein n=1 Tax=Kalmanozyma brasiliensis (strain GHG001) TaxID=1365824 RepID=V5EZ79_KALBG|nr:Alpha/beta hydrolase fold-3 [Kalmanozyma brasiliensis GHG001]EST09183.1 Alpha/beta hydrolase fold-3 [Kalmanozyma brasiliensis GHG001]
MASFHSFKFDPEFLQVAGPMLAIAAQRPQPKVHEIELRRTNLDTLLRGLGVGQPEQHVTKTTHTIKTRDGASIIVYEIAPKQRQENGAAVLHAHGGGMLGGSADAFIASGSIAHYALASGLTIFSVEYRLAPEHTLDGLVNDCYDALEWLSSNATSLGVDNKRIGVFGESAGGGIAAGVALQARDRGLSPPLRKQVLIYPMLDDRNLTPDERLVPTAIWTYESNITGWSALLGKDVAGTDKVDELVKYAVPARVHDLSRLPDTYIDVGQLDIFIEEDLEYARRLHKAGVQVDLNVYKGLPHAWELFGGQNISVGQKVLAERISALQSI